jgi:hypothetical protein
MFDISMELSTTQGEWVVKRRNCAATLNNRGSHIRQEVIFDLFLFFNTFQNLTGQHNRFDLWSENVVATLEIKIFEFFGKDATKNLNQLGNMNIVFKI